MIFTGCFYILRVAVVAGRRLGRSCALPLTATLLPTLTPVWHLHLQSANPSTRFLPNTCCNWPYTHSVPRLIPRVSPGILLGRSTLVELIIAVLNFLQEILGSTLAGVPVQKHAGLLGSLHVDGKAFAMAGYGAFVAAPLGHVLVGALQKYNPINLCLTHLIIFVRAFVGKEGLGAKIGQILASNLLVAPIQACSYLSDISPLLLIWDL